MASNQLLEAVELNNEGVLCLLNTSSRPYNQAVPLFKSSLAMLQQHMLHDELQYDNHPNICTGTPLMVSIPVVPEDDNRRFFHLYNRCFVIDPAHGLNSLKSVLAVLFNLSLACHIQGQTHKAKALYAMAWRLAQDGVTKGDSLRVLLELAIKNNLAHCHLADDKDRAVEAMESMSHTLLFAHDLPNNPLLSLEVDHLQEIEVNFRTVHSFPIIAAPAA